MFSIGNRNDDPELIKKIQGRYLRGAEKYDRWGAQGKLLVILEVLSEEGFDTRAMQKSGVEFPKLVNFVFPRSFAPKQCLSISKPIADLVSHYFIDVEGQLSSSHVVDMNIEWAALEETSSRFGIPIEQVRHIVGH